MRLQWAPDARMDRKNIRDYIAETNPVAALELDAVFQKKIAYLADHPTAGRPGRVVGTREWVVHSNYLIVYELHDQDVVLILRVLHAEREWP